MTAVQTRRYQLRGLQRVLAFGVGIGLWVGTMAAGQQAASKLPEGVTMEMVKQGAEVYSGAGLCGACHGPEAKGVPNLGSDLTDAEWVSGDGSYETILDAILKGVPAEKTSSGSPMPPRGGSKITDEQVRAVAAYVYTLSRRSK